MYYRLGKYSAEKIKFIVLHIKNLFRIFHYIFIIQIYYILETQLVFCLIVSSAIKLFIHKCKFQIGFQKFYIFATF